ncbi:MAG: Riboflavin biosynthesis protein RibD [Chlamydiae bacterium]|nr:Riboflavin biosynthesis protein RibD [Chlamydiota bacterium]
MVVVTSIEQKQAFFMNEAFEEGLKGRLLAPPNPWVGCVIVKHGEVIARGHHKGPGSDHAEVMALKCVNEDLSDATAYVTLEPCSTFGRTPPCCNALIDSGIKKVVIGILDSDPNVRGKGVARLQHAGVEVEVGILDSKIKASLASYIHHRETTLPFCILKAAISMDGKIAAKDGSSIWITGSLARKDVHLMRAQSQAILVGTATALEDEPKLTVRDIDQDFKAPLRVVLDAKGKVKPAGHLFDTSIAPTLIATSKNVDLKRKQEWLDHGCDVVTIALDETQTTLDLRNLLEELGKRGVVQLLVEGGGKVFSSLIREKLVDRLVLYMGSCLLGAEGVSLFSQLRLENIDDAIRMHLKDFTQFGKDVRLDYTF